MMMNSKQTDSNNPNIKLFADDKLMQTNPFIQDIIAALNIGVIKCLKGKPDVTLIKNFELMIDTEAELGKSSKIIVLHIDGKHIGNKPFVQDMIRGYNLGFIGTLNNIPENIRKFKIIYERS